MSEFGSFIDFTPFTNGSGQALNKTLKDEEHRLLLLTDQELARSQAVKFKDYKEYFYNNNVKTIEMFENDSDFTIIGGSSTTLSDDSTYGIVGNSNVRMTENDNVASTIGMYRTISAVNLTEFNNGAASSVNDFISLSFYLTDKTKFSSFTFRLGTSAVNNYYATYTPNTDLLDGFNTIFLKKDDFSSIGSVNWNNITWIQIEAISAINAQNEFFTVLLLQLIRLDPDNTSYPNSYQKYQGTTDGWINIFQQSQDSWNLYVDPETRQLGMNKLNTQNITSNQAGIHLQCDVINFICKLEAYCKVEDETISLTWWIDNSNYIEAYVEAGTLYLEFTESASTTTYSIILDTVLYKHESFKMYFEKEGSTVRLIFFKSGENVKILEAETSISETQEGCLCIGNYADDGQSFITDFVVSNTQGHHLDLWDKKILKKKISSQTKNNDNSFGADDDLWMWLPPNSKFEIIIKLAASGNTAADIKVAWSTGGDCEQLTTRACLGPSTSTADNGNTNMRSSSHNLGTTVAYGTDGSTTAFIEERFLVKTGLNGGYIGMEWAQWTAHASNTILSLNSYMTVEKLAA